MSFCSEETALQRTFTDFFPCFKIFFLSTSELQVSGLDIRQPWKPFLALISYLHIKFEVSRICLSWVMTRRQKWLMPSWTLTKTE